MKQIDITVPSEAEGQRLDRFMADRLNEYSRTFLQRLISKGDVKLNGKKTVARAKLAAGDLISTYVEEPEKVSILPEAIPVDVIYEDSSFIVVSKPPGMVVHPAPGSRKGTLVNALLAHCKDLSGIGGALRPGIVHRLDKNTSGIMVVAKSDSAHRSISRQVMDRTARRVYLAVVWGDAGQAGKFDAPIGRSTKDRKKMAVVPDGRRAVTFFEQIEKYRFASLVRVELETGRTHQIRVHFSSDGHPVFGDPDYGGRQKMIGGIEPSLRSAAREMLKHIDRQALHASSLTLVHPEEGQEMSFSAEPPEDFQRLVNELNADAART
jgi:23S rRNA pseudouridine1911/1915/1917 synthase